MKIFESILYGVQQDVHVGGWGGGGGGEGGEGGKEGG